MRRSPVESVSTPSAVLPSSSTLTLASEITPPPIVLCARNAKRPKPPNGTLLLPVQRIASRSDGASTLKRAFELERRLRARRAVEGELERRAGEPHLDAGALARQRREKIGEREARFDRFVMPDETAVGAETARDRRPGDLEFDVVEPLDGALLGVADDDGAVVDADFRERRGAAGIGRQRARQRLRSGPTSSTGRRAER